MKQLKPQKKLNSIKQQLRVILKMDRTMHLTILFNNTLQHNTKITKEKHYAIVFYNCF